MHLEYDDQGFGPGQIKTTQEIGFNDEGLIRVDLVFYMAPYTNPDLFFDIPRILTPARDSLGMEDSEKQDALDNAFEILHFLVQKGVKGEFLKLLEDNYMFYHGSIKMLEEENLLALQGSLGDDMGSATMIPEATMPEWSDERSSMPTYLNSANNALMGVISLYSKRKEELGKIFGNFETKYWEKVELLCDYFAKIYPMKRAVQITINGIEMPLEHCAVAQIPNPSGPSDIKNTFSGKALSLGKEFPAYFDVATLSALFEDRPDSSPKDRMIHHDIKRELKDAFRTSDPTMDELLMKVVRMGSQKSEYYTMRRFIHWAKNQRFIALEKHLSATLLDKTWGYIDDLKKYLDHNSDRLDDWNILDEILNYFVTDTGDFDDSQAT